MRPYVLHCPHCNGTWLEASDRLEEGGGEHFICTHHCLNPECDLHFRYTPEDARAEASVEAMQ